MIKIDSKIIIIILDSIVSMKTDRETKISKLQKNTVDLHTIDTRTYSSGNIK